MTVEKAREMGHDVEGYHRSFRRPKDGDQDGIDAVYENGILDVRLPIIEGSALEGQPIEVEER